MNKAIKWGVIGCGNIAQKFVKDLQYVNNSQLYAIASTNKERREFFSDIYNPKKVYKTYESLVQDENVDIVYVATTHNFHYKNTLLCLEANKPVLCEKPICINAKELKHLIGTAKKRKVFLMEALWTRFLPAVKHLITEIENGIIGKPKLIKADFGIMKPPTKGSRFYEKKLGAGALLDLGVYTINFSNFIFGKSPISVSGFAKLTTQNVDEYSAYNLKYESGQIAQLLSSVSFKTPHTAKIYGEKGEIVVHDFYHPKRYTVFFFNGKKTTIDKPFPGFGYQYEAVEAQECLLKQKTESTIFSLNDSLKALTVMDTLRKEWGITYPNDL